MTPSSGQPTCYYGYTGGPGYCGGGSFVNGDDGSGGDGGIDGSDGLGDSDGGCPGGRGSGFDVSTIPTKARDDTYVMSIKCLPLFPW